MAAWDVAVPALSLQARLLRRRPALRVRRRPGARPASVGLSRHLRAEAVRWIPQTGRVQARWRCKPSRRAGMGIAPSSPKLGHAADPLFLARLAVLGLHANTALAAGGDYAVAGGTPREQTQVRSALGARRSALGARRSALGARRLELRLEPDRPPDPGALGAYGNSCSGVPGLNHERYGANGSPRISPGPTGPPRRTPSGPPRLAMRPARSPPRASARCWQTWSVRRTHSRR